MPLSIVKNEISLMHVDAIVRGAPVSSSVSRTGQVKITLGLRYLLQVTLPAARTQAPQALEMCYRNALEVAYAHGCKSVALPLLGAGAEGFAPEVVFRVATDAIRRFLEKADLSVWLVLPRQHTGAVTGERIAQIAQYIEEAYNRTIARQQTEAADLTQVLHTGSEQIMMAVPPELDYMLGTLEESFSELLLRKISQKNMTDAQCYKKANIDRKLFSKIRSDRNYKPRKSTVLAFAVALELTLTETRELLMRAGYALTRSSKSDVVLEYFISKGIYDLFEINEALYAFDLSPLGE